MELIQQYSVSEIIIMLILLAAALKGLINFYDWAKEKILKVFHREQKKEEEKQDIEKTLSEHEERMKSLMKSQDNLNIQIQSLMEKINLLIESDRDDIKSWITEKHHFYCFNQKWIDDYSLDCLEKRFSHYEQENGNSFVEGLMKDLRSLPRQPKE